MWHELAGSVLTAGQIEPLTAFWSVLAGSLALLVLWYFWLKAQFSRRVEDNILPSLALRMFHRQLLIGVIVVVAVNAAAWFLKEPIVAKLFPPAN